MAPEYRGGWRKRWILAPTETPARAGLVEAVGACPFRTKVKRRKASVAGKLAASDEALFL